MENNIKKPMTLKVNDLVNNITNDINNASLPAFAVKMVLEGVYREICSTEEKEIEAYKQSLEKQKNAKEAKSKKV